jgi:hypothetical protein
MHVSRYLKLIETSSLRAAEAVGVPEPAKTTPDVVEATFRAAKAVALSACEPISNKMVPVRPEFPPCPECGATRYWISLGKVMCGSRRCYSAVRFILTRIEYHQVH